MSAARTRRVGIVATSGMLLFSIVAFGAIVSPAGEAGAASDVVTNCSGSPSVSGSLPFEVANAGSGDTIAFALSPSCSVITLASPINYFGDLTIVGPGAGTLAVDGGGTTQIFAFNGNDAISGLTLENGFDALSNDGGAISNVGGLTIKDCILKDNGTPALGGAIFNNGFLLVTGSTLTSNEADGGGGAIYSAGVDNNDQFMGSVTVSGSDLTANTSGGDGGAVSSFESGTSITDSTVTGNSASGNGGGVDTSSSGLTVSGSTVFRQLRYFGRWRRCHFRCEQRWHHQQHPFDEHQRQRRRAE